MSIFDKRHQKSDNISIQNHLPREPLHLLLFVLGASIRAAGPFLSLQFFSLCVSHSLVFVLRLSHNFSFFSASPALFVACVLDDTAYSTGVAFSTSKGCKPRGLPLQAIYITVTKLSDVAVLSFLQSHSFCK